MDYQWYPGHMTKSIRQLQDDIKLIDLLIEIVDARIPYSSRNPDVEKMCRGKVRIVILNKADLADEAENRRWMDYFEGQNANPILADARKKATLKRLLPLVNKACQDKIERNKRRGIINRPMRAMVAGIPNVGKSTFINSFAGQSAAKTGNKPGVTKGKQWIRLNKQIELLDTPGLLWPKFENQEVGLHIALIGSMKDENLIPEELATELIRRLKDHYAGMLADRYGIDEAKDPAHILEEVAIRRGCLKAGAEPDLVKAARILIDEFRSAKIGRVTLESAEDLVP